MTKIAKKDFVDKINEENLEVTRYLINARSKDDKRVLCDDMSSGIAVEIESETIDDIVSGEYKSEDTAMLKGSNRYRPLTHEEIDELVEVTLGSVPNEEEQPDEESEEETEENE